MAWLFTIVCLAALGATLYAEWQRPRQKRFPKMAAATAYIAVAIAVGVLDTTFGKIMLVGLVLSWLGDLFLTYSGRTTFVAGLVAFLAGHVAYVAAFANRGFGDELYLPALALIVIPIPIAGWLLPTVPRELKAPVVAYMVVITLMLAAASQTSFAVSDWRIPAGALAFYLSDLGVARDRFAAPGLVNRLVGLPLYFGGQLLLAWAAGG
jgi:uncharacterized membrane protein YhhN